MWIADIGESSNFWTQHALLEFILKYVCLSVTLIYKYWHQIRQGYPLNLSILLSGGKETKKDVLSSGEWIGQSSKLKSSLILYRLEL